MTTVWRIRPASVDDVEVLAEAQRAKLAEVIHTRAAPEPKENPS